MIKSIGVLALVLTTGQGIAKTSVPSLERLPKHEAEEIHWNKPMAGLRFDCLYYALNKKEECLKITAVKLGYKFYNHDRERGMALSFNPLSSSNANFKKSPLIESSLDGKIESSIVDDLYLGMILRPHLELAVEKYSGPVPLSDTSGLAFGGNFFDRGWDQTALTVAASLAAREGSQMKLILGNGEAKVFKGSETQRYFGLEARAFVLPSLLLAVEMSFNGNSIGGESYQQDIKRWASACGVVKIPGRLGYSTNRMGAHLALDGQQVWARGLRAGLGWQNTEKRDLDEKKDTYLSAAELSHCSQEDEDKFFIEDPSHEKEFALSRTVSMVSASYRFLDMYVVGLDYELKKMTANGKQFSLCGEYAEGRCRVVIDSKKSLSLTSLTAGLGFDQDDGLNVSLEYNVQVYGDEYDKFFFLSGANPSRERKIINLRVAYQWE